MNYEFLIDKSFFDESTIEECQVCKTNWNEWHKINLKCNHNICIDCLYQLFKTDNNLCQVCRTKLLIK